MAYFEIGHEWLTELRRRRENAGLSEHALELAAGLQPGMYGDLERYGYEFTYQISLAEARRVCAVLGLELPRVLGVDPLRRKVTHGAVGVLIAKRRVVMGFSRDDLGDQVGYDAEAIRLVEEDNALDDFPPALLLELARVLQVDPAELLN